MRDGPFRKEHAPYRLDFTNISRVDGATRSLIAQGVYGIEFEKRLRHSAAHELNVKNVLEVLPNPEHRITLSDQKDAMGIPKPQAHYSIDDYTRLWWDVRPHPRFGTLEIRMPDQPTAVERACAFVALLHALCATLLEAPAPPVDSARRGGSGRAVMRSVTCAARVPASRRPIRPSSGAERTWGRFASRAS